MGYNFMENSRLVQRELIFVLKNLGDDRYVIDALQKTGLSNLEIVELLDDYNAYLREHGQKTV